MKRVVAIVVLMLAWPAVARATPPCEWTPTLCKAPRPAPSVTASTLEPRDGGSLVLTARETGRGSTIAWDLDGDGAYDDAVGETVAATFTGAPAVAVRETDQFGRTGVDSVALHGHAGNRPPSGRIVLTPRAPRVLRPVTMRAVGDGPGRRNS